MPETEIDETADEIAHLLVRVYEIHEIIIAETGGLIGLRDAALASLSRCASLRYFRWASTLRFGF